MRFRFVLPTLAAIVVALAIVPVLAATKTYTVQKGEGLADVARKHGVSLSVILKLNRSRLPDRDNPDVIYPGMNVLVPAPEPKPSPVPATQPDPQQKKPSGTTGKGLETQSPIQDEDTAPKIKNDIEAPTDAVTPPAVSPTTEKESDSKDDSLQWIVWLLGIIAVAVIAIGIILYRRGHAIVAGPDSDNGPLRLIASKDLGKNAKVFWFRAGEKDLFISTGADAQILAIETAPQTQQNTQPAAPSLPATQKTPPSRRPRKNSAPQTPPASSITASEEGNDVKSEDVSD